MKIKDKIKSYSFWVSLASAVILILKVLGNRFGFTVDETMVSDLFTALCSILVLLGIIVVPSNQNLQITHKGDSVLNQSEQEISTKQIEANLETINQDIKETNYETQVNPLVESENSTETNIICPDNEVAKNNFTEEASSITVCNELNESTHQETPILETPCSIDNSCMSENDDNLVSNNIENASDSIIENEASKSNEENNSAPNISNLKDLFNLERAKFAQNLNEYIFELQEEIRKARENM